MATLEVIIGYLREVSIKDRGVLLEISDDLFKDTPSTTNAAKKVKAILVKAGPNDEAMFRDNLVDVVSETAKKFFFQINLTPNTGC